MTYREWQKLIIECLPWFLLGLVLPALVVVLALYSATGWLRWQ